MASGILSRLRPIVQVLCGGAAAFAAGAVYIQPRDLSSVASQQAVENPHFMAEVMRVRDWQRRMNIDIPVEVIATNGLSNGSIGGTLTGHAALALSHTAYGQPSRISSHGAVLLPGMPEFERMADLFSQSRESRDFTITHELAHVRYNHSLVKAVFDPLIGLAAFEYSAWRIRSGRWATAATKIRGASCAFVIAVGATIGLSWFCELQADFAAVRLDPAVRQGAVERMHKTQALLSSKERTGVGLLARASERMRGLSTHPPTSLRVWLATHLPPGDAQGT